MLSLQSHNNIRLHRIRINNILTFMFCACVSSGRGWGGKRAALHTVPAPLAPHLPVANLHSEAQYGRAILGQ